MNTFYTILAVLAALPSISPAEGRRTRYALLLRDAPLAESAAPGAKAAGSESRLAAAQSTLRLALADRRVEITGSAQIVLNAIFVAADPARAAELASLPGVARVVEMLPIKRQAVKALELVRAQEAWRNLNGEANAGSGVRIAVLDSGIDHLHPAFRDPSLTAPSGFPRCAGSDCSFTTTKVIAARSYVQMLVLGDNPLDSRPDDLSARDRVGHGTAVAMMAAGARHDSPLGSLSGVAPKAFLGNYKIFGSPGVNDTTFDDVVIRALDDAVRDGMDIAVLSLGRPAVWSPADRGTVCDLPNNRPCDPWADAVEQATRAGMTVVVAAGNDGDIGLFAPSYNSVHTPGTVESALTVGASTNSQRYFSAIRVTGAAPPLSQIFALVGDGPRPAVPLTAPLRDVRAAQGEDARACSPLSNGSLSGTIAIVEQGGCAFSTKVNNAQKAGAAGVIVQRPENANALFPMTGLKETGIPAAMIGGANGKALRDYLESNAGAVAAMDPSTVAAPFDPDIVAFFSSYGPGIGGGNIKPEVVAPGQAIYMATQSFDPNGDMYSADGFVAAQGTSFAAPIAAGAAALFKQRFRAATAAQVKSAVVNTAVAAIDDFDNNDKLVRASVRAVGAGKIDAANVTRVDVTAEPATLSFGYIDPARALPSAGVRINNHGAAQLNLRVEVQPRFTETARVAVDQSGFTVPGRGSRQLSFSLSGGRPSAGVYEGDVVISGGAVPIRIPYLYIVGDNVVDNLIPLRGFDFVAQVNSRFRIAFKAVDKYGAPVSNATVRYRATLGDGRIDTAFPRTDNLGISDATVIAGPRLGPQEFAASIGNTDLFFSGFGRLQPTIRTDGVTNAASGQVGRGVAPGSFASIFGRDLADSLRVASTAWLPTGLAGVSVSFDVPERRISASGKIYFVSDGQINVQVPWELQGLNSAIVKVSIGNVQSDLYTVPLNDYSPAAFEYTDPSSGRLLAGALDSGFLLVSPDNAAQRGGLVQLYVNGLGPVDNAPATGEPTPTDTLRPTRVLPEVTIGSRPAEVLFSGLAPGNVGLYQINVRIPADSPVGVQPVVITTNGIVSKTSNIPVR